MAPLYIEGFFNGFNPFVSEPCLSLISLSVLIYSEVWNRPLPHVVGSRGFGQGISGDITR